MSTYKATQNVQHDETPFEEQQKFVLINGVLVPLKDAVSYDHD